MNVDASRKIISPNLDKVPGANFLKNKAIDIAHQIGDFIDNNRSKVFFAATVLFCIAVTANPFVGMPVGEIAVSGILTAASLHGLAVLFGSNVFSDTESLKKLDVILGIINLCSWYLHPIAGVSTAIFNTGSRTCSFLFSKIFEIKRNPECSS